MTPTVLDIVCFRHNPHGRDEGALRELNIEIMLRMQETGIAAVSDTMVKERQCLRVTICNHRTQRTDLDLLVQAVLRIGGEVVAMPITAS